MTAPSPDVPLLDVPLLDVRGLSKSFPVRRGVLRRRTGSVRAVDDVSLTIGPGETLGLVGESGSGKSTTARLVLRLIEADAGRILFEGQDLRALDAARLRGVRRRIQMVFQDPYSSLDPLSPVLDIVAEPLDVHHRFGRAERRARVAELLAQVGLRAEAAERYPREFSGGQRQRIAIARAIALDPRLIVADEPVSALDVSTQAQVVNLMQDLQDRLGVSYLFIAHDLSVVRHISHRIAVMYLGGVVEVGPSREIVTAPRHPYTQALLSAVPSANPRAQRERTRIVLVGDVPSPADPPSGCAFHTRCPYAMPVCAEQVPEPTEVGPGAWVACHLHTHGLTLAGGPLPASQGRHRDALDGRSHTGLIR